MPGRFSPRLAGLGLALLLIPTFCLPQAQSADAPAKSADATLIPFPSPETLSYNVEWRLIYAGSARLSLAKRVDDSPVWRTQLHLESGGLVSKLYKLDDSYDGRMENQFCATATHLNAMEGKRHRETKVAYDYSRGKATYEERDLLKNSVIKNAEADIPACVADIIGSLYKLRMLKLDPGQSAQVPISDGKKTVSARVEARDRETVKVEAGTFDTIRYEAFVFNGVLYARKAQLYIWLTNDPRRLPVQVRARMSFPVGSITFTLTKEEHP